MATQDTCCTVVPYFKASAGKLEQFQVFMRTVCGKVIHRAEVSVLWLELQR